MRAFLTGGTGFVGGAVARALRKRGDDVVALVREPKRAGQLDEIGCELVRGELPGTDLAAHVGDADAVFHVGGQYRVGLQPRERPGMHRANVEATRAVLEAAERARTRRIVYVSTVGTFGNTGGKMVDESYRRAGRDFLSYYDETKYLAHELAESAVRRGVPVLMALPSQVYGPGDHSAIGEMIRQAGEGRLRAKVLADAGVCMVHVDDLAAGVLAAHDRGRIGESYVLAGECVRLGELVDRVAEIARKPKPRFTVPTTLLRAAATPVTFIGRPFGGPNLRETVRTGDGVTFWASNAKSRSELEWQPRPLDQGLRELLAST